MLPHDTVDLLAIEERRKEFIQQNWSSSSSFSPKKRTRKVTFKVTLCCELGRRLEAAGKRLQAIA